MKGPLFILQDALELLVAQGKVDLDGRALTIRQSDSTYRLVPAVKILCCESSGGDPLKLVGKIIPIRVLNDSGAVTYLNSITMGRHSYLIDHGYICRKDAT